MNKLTPEGGTKRFSFTTTFGYRLEINIHQFFPLNNISEDHLIADKYTLKNIINADHIDKHVQILTCYDEEVLVDLFIVHVTIK